jgi:hypothetical protein
MPPRSSNVPATFYLAGLFCLTSSEIVTVNKPTGGNAKFARYASQARADVANSATSGLDDAVKHFLPVTMRMFVGRGDAFEDDTVLFVVGRAGAQEGPSGPTIVLDPLFHCKVGEGSPSTNDEYFDSIPSFGPTMVFVSGVSSLPLRTTRVGGFVSQVSTSAYIIDKTMSSTIRYVHMHLAMYSH